MKPGGYGVAGRLASMFLDSKITPLLMLASLLLGALAIVQTPREEEPQIVVPFADVMVGLPGASPKEVEDRVTRPMERLLMELPGVKYVYSTSLPDMAMITVRFKVGDDQERSMVKLYDALAGSMDQMPPGATPPLVKARLIDDVPILALTLWKDEGDEMLLRDLAAGLEDEVRAVPNVSVTHLIGGRRRTLEVQLNSRALAAAGIPPQQVIGRLRAANAAAPGGELVANNQATLVRTNAFLKTREDVASVVVGVMDGRPVRLGSVATVTEVPETQSYVAFAAGAAMADEPDVHRGGMSSGGEAIASAFPTGRTAPAVTLTIAKRKGADATRVAAAVLQRVEEVRGRLLPSDVHLTVARDYGETANEKASDLLLHLGIAIVLVTVLTGLVLGLRGGAVVFVSVPVTFALTLFTYYIFGYTLNRVTLFALIFIAGIVVDDSIIIVENIYRHFRMHRGHRPQASILAAVSEVGNPTVLATLTVIASVLPMAYVGGLMGPYMRPMPIGASLAMTFSLLVALTMSPWLSKKLLKRDEEHGAPAVEGEDEESAPAAIRRVYNRVVGPLLDRPRKGLMALGGIALLLVLSFGLLPLKLVTVKMLPFDNKSEIQLLVDMPEGTPLEVTDAAAHDMAEAVASVPEVEDLQVYAGAASPITFNGLVRHYDFRQSPNAADIQVNLKPKKERRRKSHELAGVLRERALPVAERYGARLKVVEVPPGPPVLSTMVAEVYGPDQKSRLELASKVKKIMEDTPGVVDVDWMVEAPQPEWNLHVDPTRAALAGVAPASVVQAVHLALSGTQVGALHPNDTFEPVPIMVRWPRDERNSLLAVSDLRLPSERGDLVPAAAVTTPVRTERAVSRYRKNGVPVVYVVAELSGQQESPVYAILDMKKQIDGLTGSRGETVSQLFAADPSSQTQYAVRWDGEWQITREVFRDLGLAFGVVLILIYMLIAGWFQDLRTPLIMMVSIPLSLVGILIGHWVFHGFFTATSMIGFIALAGVMVRNGVLLLDFVGLARERGLPLKEAILEAGAVRVRPIVLTAGTVIVGAIVILFDPIFQGLAISLIGGSITATVLTLVVVPILYYLQQRGSEPVPAAATEDA
jgi:multidrug efflux pump subunit AcrB